MDFKEISELFGVFKKLYTSHYGEDKLIFYRNVNSMNGVLMVSTFTGTVDKFSLNSISHMSLSKTDGLLIQYDTPSGRKLYPYKLDSIKEVNVDLN